MFYCVGSACHVNYCSEDRLLTPVSIAPRERLMRRHSGDHLKEPRRHEPGSSSECALAEASTRLSIRSRVGRVCLRLFADGLKRKLALISVLLGGVLSGCTTGVGNADTSARLAKAKALFAQRCQTAGEKIARTVESVEGVLLLKVRPSHVNFGDQFALDDPYGSDLGGEGYIQSFTRGSYQVNAEGTPAPGSPPRLGFLYVEAADPADGRRYRYTGRIEEPWQTNKSFLKGYLRFALDKAPAPEKPPRYGVTYDDISTQEERAYWIAGSSLRVIDLQTNEVIGERVGYMMDVLQGDRLGGRSPWLAAADHACPTFFRNPLVPARGPAFAAQARQAQDFVEKVLKPKLAIEK
jgi:hypothetical protein